jgi:transposase-like protein
MQRYKCKICKSTFTDTSARGRPLSQKLLALTLWKEGVSLNKIAEQFDLSTPAVWKWVNVFKKQDKFQGKNHNFLNHT